MTAADDAGLPCVTALFVAVMLGMQLRGLSRVVLGMNVMTMRRLCMVRGLLMMARLMMLCRFAVMPSSVLVMFRRFAMMFANFSHDVSPM